MALIFEVKDGCFSYGTSYDVLSNISFSVSDGEILSVLGPNGVGKTTLLKCMMGLMKWKRGGTYLDGTDIKALTQKQLWQRIAYVPQAKNSVFSYTAMEMVLLGRSAHIGMTRQPKRKDYLIAERAMETVGISWLKDKLCNKMSGGELQMVLIARAIATQPKLLVLDEPESNLDFKNQIIILEAMQSLVKNEGISCIFNTHYPAHALKVSEKALLLTPNGRARFGATDKIVSPSNMRDAFSVNVHIGDMEIGGKFLKTVVPLSIA